MRLPRLNSLFTRLLLAQAALAAMLVAVVVGFLFIERNNSVAVIYADALAPRLGAAAGLPVMAPSSAPVLRRADAPPPGRRLLAQAPRFVALRDALRAHGVAVDDMRVGLDSDAPTLWLHVLPPGGPGLWLGMPGDVIVPEWSRRIVAALLTGVLLLVAVSWAFARRLTRPLENLRARMEQHIPGRSEGGASSRVTGSPEIAAIDAAWSDLAARLQRHERERALLLAGVSHDLRSPLGRIRLAAELLPPGGDVQVRRNAIVRNVSEADRLIESFLDFVRSGELAFDETVDLAGIGRKVCASFERSTQALRVEAPDTLMWPHANHLLVERLIANLIDNAQKHGRPPVLLRIGRDDAEAWIEVCDEGDGMLPDQALQMQEAFARGDASRSSAGSGLGLAIVRQVVMRLGGTLALAHADGIQCARVTLTPRSA